MVGGGGAMRIVEAARVVYRDYREAEEVAELQCLSYSEWLKWIQEAQWAESAYWRDVVMVKQDELAPSGGVA